MAAISPRGDELKQFTALCFINIIIAIVTINIIIPWTPAINPDQARPQKTSP